MNNIKPIFSSSVNPNEVSLFVSGLAKVIIGIIGFVAVRYGFDFTTATNGAQQVFDLIVTAIPAGFAVWHTLQAVYGLTRKMFVASVA